MRRSPLLPLVVALLAGAAGPVTAQSAGWATLGDGDNGSTSVAALTFGPDGRLYVAGGVYSITGVPTPGIAAWDGQQWHSVGPPAHGTGGMSNLAFALDGRLYAGGTSRGVGGASTRGVAVWDGSAWADVGGGVYRQQGDDLYTAAVRELAAAPQGGMYVGGDFNRAGVIGQGIPVGLVAWWDGSAWSAVGGAGLDGPRGNGAPVVLAMVVGPDGRLYVGGEFTTADGQPVAHVAAWDGTAWDGLDGGLPGASIRALAFGPDGRLYAGGLIATVGGVETDLAAWDGTAWAPVGPDIDGGTALTATVYTLAFSADGKLYAGGFFTLPDGSRRVARLDGYLAGPGAGTWVPLGGGVTHPTGESNVRALAVGPEGEVYVGGFFDRVWEAPGGPSMPASNVAVWLGDRVVGAEEPVAAGALALSVSPNPSRGASTVSVTPASPSAVRVVVVDALGRTVAVVHDGPLSAGRHRLALPPSLAPGVYAVRVTSGEASATARWVVAR